MKMHEDDFQSVESIPDLSMTVALDSAQALTRSAHVRRLGNAQLHACVCQNTAERQDSSRGKTIKAMAWLIKVEYGNTHAMLVQLT